MHKTLVIHLLLAGRGAEKGLHLESQIAALGPEDVPQVRPPPGSCELPAQKAKVHG